jgi:hypothetical protein
VTELPVHTATRYVQPLREGGSLPAVIDTRDAGMFVAKFRGAGQGVKVLIAEIVVALLAREAGLPTPEIALIEVLDAFGRSEPDPEIQDLLRASHGLNFGARYLDGAFNFDSNAAQDFVAPDLAARIVWLDAYVTNPDRTHRNPNLMVCGRKPYLIDHGAALYAQHDWASVDEVRTRAGFPLIKDHMLLARADDIRAADEELAPRFTPEVIAGILGAVPDDFLSSAALRSDFDSPDAARSRYAEYLVTRVKSPRAFVDEAIAAKDRGANTPPRRVMSRR